MGSIENSLLYGSANKHKLVLMARLQSRRLLVLRHASKCIHTEMGQCKTPHCLIMQTAFQHILNNCTDSKCRVPHCTTSRYILIHYSRCKDLGCAICEPTRSASKLNYERNKDQYFAAACLQKFRAPSELSSS